MYERLDKLRDELRKAEKRKEDADKKLKIAQDRLREAESTQILADVEALHLTPEQVGQFLSMAANGQLPGIGAGLKREDSSGKNVVSAGDGSGDSELEDDDPDKDPEEYGSHTDTTIEEEDEQTENEEGTYHA